jgi:SAM-dependent methyltransferase
VSASQASGRHLRKRPARRGSRTLAGVRLPFRLRPRRHDPDVELDWWLRVWDPVLREGGHFGARCLELCGDADVAPTYEGRRWQQARAEVARVLEEAGIEDATFFEGKVVVDVGPGLVGFPDACPARTSIAVEPLAPRFREHGLLLESDAIYLASGAESVPLLEASVDVVVSRNSLDHVDSPERAIAEVARILRPGGTLILNVDTGHPPTAAEPHSFEVEDVRKLLAPFDVEHERLLDESHGEQGRTMVVLARKRA